MRKIKVGSIYKHFKGDYYIVEDIGEYAGTYKSKGYLTYRTQNPNWDKIPYDIEFDSGSTIADLLKKLTDLYPNEDEYKSSNPLYIDFLVSDRVITFTDTNGKLMALKPDVTLSIINVITLALFAIASITDYFDGHIARKEVGHILDPLLLDPLQRQGQKQQDHTDNAAWDKMSDQDGKALAQAQKRHNDAEPRDNLHFSTNKKLPQPV